MVSTFLRILGQEKSNYVNSYNNFWSLMSIQSNGFRRKIRPYPSLERKDMMDLGVFSEHRRKEWQ